MNRYQNLLKFSLDLFLLCLSLCFFANIVKNLANGYHLWLKWRSLIRVYGLNVVVHGHKKFHTCFTNYYNKPPIVNCEYVPETSAFAW